MTAALPPTLLYDGLCGFCDSTVQFVLKRDRRGTMRFATLQGDFARQVLQRHPELAGIDSLILVEPDPARGEGAERVSVRSTSVLRLATYVGGVWQLAQAFYAIPGPIRDWAYDLFARYRYRLFGRYDSCPVPTPEQRARFID